jgi:hypothetical protein
MSVANSDDFYMTDGSLFLPRNYCQDSDLIREAYAAAKALAAQIKAALEGVPTRVEISCAGYVGPHPMDKCAVIFLEAASEYSFRDEFDDLDRREERAVVRVQNAQEDVRIFELGKNKGWEWREFTQHTGRREEKLRNTPLTPIAAAIEEIVAWAKERPPLPERNNAPPFGVSLG